MPWYGYAVAAVIVIVALWLVGDFLHALVVRLWNARWEKRIERDAEGVRAGCREGTLGEGDTALLLVHGYGESPSVWRRMAPALAASGFTVRTLRLPGHGLPMAQYRRTDSIQWREAVRQALAEMRPRYTRVVVVAHSMGCAAALDGLVDRQDVADGLVLMAPLIDVGRRRSPLLHPRTWFRLLDSLLLFTDRIVTIFPPDLHDRAAHALVREDRFVPRVVHRELFAVVARNRDRAKAFHLPLLMVLARDDLVVDVQAAGRFFADYAGAPKRLQMLTGVGHMLPFDYGWDKIVDEIARFAREEAEQGATQR
jgi:alpha-beta hydrolase superfamily lysophospholipase